MKIETKYNIGDKVWVVYEPKESGEVSVYSDTIIEIAANSRGIYYLTEYTDLEEKDIVRYEDSEGLVEKIKEKMNAILEREKENEKNK